MNTALRAAALASLCALALVEDAHAQRGRTRSPRGALVVGGAPRSVVQVLGFSEDGTRALLVKRDVARAPGLAELGVSYAVVDATGVRFEARVSEAVYLRGSSRAVAEGVEAHVCRDRVAALEQALAGFRSVRARQSGCARPSRAESVVQILETTPSPLALSEELRALQDEIGMHDGVVFVNERGPLVVVVRVDREDLFGQSNEALTFLREDPRLHDRWPSPAR